MFDRHERGERVILLALDFGDPDYQDSVAELRLLAEGAGLDVLGEVLGDLWALGKLSVTVEHLASEVVVQLLKQELTSGSAPGPVLLGACLPEEHHEWGFMVTLTALKTQGWRIEYLGANLPLKDIAEAAWTLVPRVIALSAADPANVRNRLPELRRLPRLVPPGTLVVLGGEGAEVNSSRLRRAGLKVGAAAIPEARPVTAPPLVPRLV